MEPEVQGLNCGSFPNCAPSGKLHYLLVPQVPQLENEDNVYLLGLLRGLNELIHVMVIIANTSGALTMYQCKTLRTFCGFSRRRN